MSRRIWSKTWTFEASFLEIGVSMIAGGALVGILWKRYHILRVHEREENFAAQEYSRDHMQWDRKETDEIRKARDELRRMKRD